MLLERAVDLNAVSSVITLFCVFELWSPEVSGSGTRKYYRETLTRAMTETETAFAVMTSSS